MKKRFFGLFVLFFGLMFSQCSPDAPVTISITIDTPLQFDEGGSSIEIVIHCNYPWTASSNQPWCTVSPDNGPAGTFTLTVTVTGEMGGSSPAPLMTRSSALSDIRTAIITIHSNGQEQTITVTQEVEPEEPTIQEIAQIFRFTNGDWVTTFFDQDGNLQGIVPDGAVTLSANAITTSTAGVHLSNLYTMGGNTANLEKEYEVYVDDVFDRYEIEYYQFAWAYLCDASGKIGIVWTLTANLDSNWEDDGDETWWEIQTAFGQYSCLLFMNMMMGAQYDVVEELQKMVTNDIQNDYHYGSLYKYVRE
ncbi:MAG: BACON domain-containing protein [Bacteroidales bacterium]|nr:BACON domain-containing protein [Bacteroidales bacterium]